jgi:hypothetical protein
MLDHLSPAIGGMARFYSQSTTLHSQAPVHTDSLTVYETELRVIPTEEGEGAEIRRPVVKAKAVVEQRVSHFIMGLGSLAP